MLITVEAVSKQPRQFNNQTIWGVMTPNKTWYSLACDFKPAKGQVFDVAVTETIGNNGQTYRNAQIIGPAPTQQPTTAPPPGTAIPLPNGVDASRVIVGQPSGKVPWDEWVRVINATTAISVDLNMPPEVQVGLLQTTLVTLRDGKLESPPVPTETTREPGQDDDTIPW